MTDTRDETIRSIQAYADYQVEQIKRIDQLEADNARLIDEEHKLRDQCQQAVAYGDRWRAAAERFTHERDIALAQMNQLKGKRLAEADSVEETADALRETARRLRQDVAEDQLSPWLGPKRKQAAVATGERNGNGHVAEPLPRIVHQGPRQEHEGYDN